MRPRNTGFQPGRKAWHGLETRVTGNLIVVAVACVFAVYMQLVVGAMMRHYDAGMAIPDLPLAYGRVLPPIDAGGLDSINQIRAWEYHLPGVTIGQVWLHFGHRIGACIVTLAVITLSGTILRKQRTRRALLAPALLLLVLLATQITLGAYTVLRHKPADIASAHVACGALVLVTSFVIAVRAARLYSPMTQTFKSMTPAPVDQRHSMAQALPA